MTLRKLRIPLLRLSLAPIVFVILFVRPAWSLESKVAFFIEFGGYVFLLAGLAVRIWCTFYIGGRKSNELITKGPFSICRNPLYIGTFLLSVGVSFCFENLLMLALVLLIIIPIHLAIVRMEETHLEKLFGEQYRKYKRKTPSFSLESLTMRVP